MWGSYQLQIFSARDLWVWRRQGDLVCVEWDTKPQLNQSINQSINHRAATAAPLHAAMQYVMYFRFCE